MVRIWTRILTALRGGAHELGESVIASQALRILDQEIRDAEAQLTHSRSSLASLMGKGLLCAAEVTRTEERLASLTTSAEMAIAAGREDLALEVAGQISRLEPVLAQDTRIAREYSDMACTLRDAVTAGEDRLRELKTQLEVVRATARMQQAQAALSASGHGSTARLKAAADALDEVRQRQRETAARLQAQEEVMAGEAGLEQRLRKAGIPPDGSSASRVLQRIKANASRSACAGKDR